MAGLLRLGSPIVGRSVNFLTGRRMMDAFWAVPEWAPADESHLLGSRSAVTKISYGASSVTYSAFDSDSTDVPRLNFVPETVTDRVFASTIWRSLVNSM